MNENEQPNPPFFDSYGAVYSFIVLFGLAGIAAIGAFPAYASTSGYFGVLAWPPVAATASLLLTERRPGTWPGLAGRTALLTFVASFATVLMITFAIPVINLAHARPLLAPRGVAGVTVGVIALVAFIIVPLIAGSVRALRAQARPGSYIRVGAIVLALVVALVVAFMTLVPGYPLAGVLRDDQAYAVLMVVSWYAPAYALATAAARKFGLG